MAFVTGMILIDAPASALNNSGERILGARTENTAAVKFINTRRGNFPYVSGQAARYWLRNTLETEPDWKASPLYRDEKAAYSAANPIDYWDDDLLGYMRAPSTSAKAKQARAEDPAYETLTPLETNEKNNEVTVTRVSPFRISTLVSIAPVNITNDFGVMARQEGDPVPFEHQFYRTMLHGLFSLDLNSAGKFYYRRRSGFQNLDEVRRQIAEEQGLQHLEDERAYQLSGSDRATRAAALLRGLARLYGGARQAKNYTDVSPAVCIAAVTRGGNHPFNYLFREASNGEVIFEQGVFIEAIRSIRSQLLSPVFIGWKPGFLLEQQPKTRFDDEDDLKFRYGAPSQTMDELGNWLQENTSSWDA